VHPASATPRGVPRGRGACGLRPAAVALCHGGIVAQGPPGPPSPAVYAPRCRIGPARPRSLCATVALWPTAPQLMCHRGTVAPWHPRRHAHDQGARWAKRPPKRPKTEGYPKYPCKARNCVLSHFGPLPYPIYHHGNPSKFPLYDAGFRRVTGPSTLPPRLGPQEPHESEPGAPSP